MLLSLSPCATTSSLLCVVSDFQFSAHVYTLDSTVAVLYRVSQSRREIHAKCKRRLHFYNPKTRLQLYPPARLLFLPIGAAVYFLFLPFTVLLPVAGGLSNVGNLAIDGGLGVAGILGVAGVESTLGVGGLLGVPGAERGEPVAGGLFELPLIIGENAGSALVYRGRAGSVCVAQGQGKRTVLGLEVAFVVR
jgi:hypothetical protein